MTNAEISHRPKNEGSKKDERMEEIKKLSYNINDVTHQVARRAPGESIAGKHLVTSCELGYIVKHRVVKLKILRNLQMLFT